VLAAVVETVAVAVPPMATGAVGIKQVAPSPVVGEASASSWQVSVTVPVYPLTAVTETVDKFPVAAPGAKLAMFVAKSVNVDSPTVTVDVPIPET
jgi:hypothetical protein